MQSFLGNRNKSILTTVTIYLNVAYWSDIHPIGVYLVL